jgi:uncharacterized protein
MSEDQATGMDIRQQIRQAIRHLAHVLPGQAPIKDFVHHNTLHGYQHLPFPEALASARRLTGANGYLPLESYREFYRQGRISAHDLLAVIDDDAALEPDAVLAQHDASPLRRRDIYFVLLTLPPQPVSGSQLDWQIEENRALERLDSSLPGETRTRLLQRARQQGQTTQAAAVADLWQACLDALHLEHNPAHPEELFDLAPERAESMLHELLEGTQGENGVASSTYQLMQQAANERLAAYLERLGRDLSMRDLLLALTGHDLLEAIRPRLVRELSNFLDQGVACRPSGEPDGFYAYWRSHAVNDPYGSLQDIESWQQHMELLDNDPLDTIISELHRMGLARERWVGYLQRLALELPGWSGMMLWRHNHAGYEALPARVDMLDYLAVCLVLERIHAHHLCASHFNVESSLGMLRWYFRRNPDEFTVREALFNSRLPEYLASRAQRAVHSPLKLQQTSGEPHWQHLSHLIWTWRHSGLEEQSDRPGICQGA